MGLNVGSVEKMSEDGLKLDMMEVRKCWRRTLMLKREERVNLKLVASLAVGAEAQDFIRRNYGLSPPRLGGAHKYLHFLSAFLFDVY